MSANDWRATLANLSGNKVSNKIAVDADLKAKLKSLVKDSPAAETTQANQTSKKKQKFFAPNTNNPTKNEKEPTKAPSQNANKKSQSLGNDFAALANLRADLAKSEKENAEPIRKAGFGGYKLGSKKNKEAEQANNAQAGQGAAQGTDQGASQTSAQTSANSSTANSSTSNSANSQSNVSSTKATSSTNTANSAQLVYESKDLASLAKLEQLIEKKSAYVGMSAPRNAGSSKATSVSNQLFNEDEEESAVLRQIDRLQAKQRKIKAHKDNELDEDYESSSSQPAQTTARSNQQVQAKHEQHRGQSKGQHKGQNKERFSVNLKATRVCLDLFLAKLELTLHQEEQLFRQLRQEQEKAQVELTPQATQAFLAALQVAELKELTPEQVEKVEVANLNSKELQLLQKFTLACLAQAEVYQQRQAALPTSLEYNPDLPVSQQIELIRKLLRYNQVVVIAGDTGSGKTTQIPKLCLELGYSKKGYIGHTQPRRIAASSVAKRIAEELNTEFGGVVGYKVRFNEQVSAQTHIKLMTDGILLAEMQNDPLLKQYSCLIIDEAHERSLNNDFILGYLKLILARRPDLKVIITSATIDVHRFSRHFNNCPVVEVAGRTFPVEVRYRPLTLDQFVSDSSVNEAAYFAELEQDLKEHPQEYVQAQENAQAQAYAQVNENTFATQSSTESNAGTPTNASLKATAPATQTAQVAPATQTAGQTAQATTSDSVNSSTSSSEFPARGTTVGHSRRRQANLRADETFGLSTVNPYASDNDAGSAFARRIYSDKSPKAEDLATQKAQATEANNQAQADNQGQALDSVATSTYVSAYASASSSQTFVRERTGTNEASNASTASTANTTSTANNPSSEQSSARVFSASQTNANHTASNFRTNPQDLKALKNYRRYAEDEDTSIDLSSGIIAACEELFQEGRGDILVFLSGEREIRDVSHDLSQHFTHVNRRFPGLKVLPLYSRLSAGEQQLIFKPDGSLRIILATNIAETSLTVPGIKYVIDAGTARISRYNYKTQVQGLPIEAISKASANQRKGRCGRTSPGICIRLYSQEDFDSRPDFTDPEIKRTNLSAVILKMLSLNLPHIEDFPFLEAPERSFIRSGLRLLEQLEAIRVTDSGYVINKLGKQLAELPVDPRLGRMILEASHLGSLNEMLILAAGMTVVDVRERPQGKAEHAQQLHAEYKDKNSDYMTLLNLWNFLFTEKMSNTQFRKFCKRRYLNYLRVREWQDLYSQLKLVALQLKLKLNQVPASYPEIHRAMLPGLLDHIAQIDSSDKLLYRGARGKTFRFFNTSVLYKQRKSWVMVSEMLHLNQTYAMLGASIEPSWVEPYARHLLKYAYQQPHWSKKRGEVCAYMSANLFGLTIIDKRLVSYSKVDPEVSRALFIRQALVEQNWDKEYDFYLHNNTLLAQALKVEEQQRKRGIVISEEDLFHWYASRIPAHVNSNVSFARWWEKQEKKDPHYLDINLEQVLNPEQELTTFPEYIQDQHWKLKLNYLFDPESKWDGVNVLIPIQYLQGLDPRLYQWHIANYRQELVEALIRNLPKNLRKQLIPAPDYARVFCERINEVLSEKGKVLSFYQVLAQTFKRINGAYIEAAIWQEAANNLPAHLQVHFKVLGLQGEVIAQGNDLAQLQQDLQHTSQELVNTKSQQDLERAKVYTDFNFTQEFGQMRQLKKGGILLDSYPALMPVLTLEASKRKALNKQLQAIPAQDLMQNNIASGVIIQNLATASEQKRVMHAGLRDLLLLNSQNPIRFLQEKLPNKAKLAMYFSGNVSQIIAECIRCAADHIMSQYDEQAHQHGKTELWNQAYYEFLLDKMRGEINQTTYKVAQLVEQILVLANDINKELKKVRDLEVMLATNDIKQQLATLTRQDFVAEHTLEQLRQVPRYLEAILYRLERMGQNPALDQKRQEEVNAWEQVYQDLAKDWPSYRDPQALTELFFMIQEFRVSLFAQTLGSRIPVSSKRIEQYIEQIKENVI